MRDLRGRGRRALLILWLALGAAVCCRAAERVVAVGDIHGAYQEFVSVLQTTGLIDKTLNWTGGKTILVQTGDAVDRGPGSRQVVDLLLGLAEKARKQGGELRPLLGNHEVMLMTGDTSYLVPEDYHSFVSDDSEKVRQREYENYVKYRKRRAARFKQPEPPSDGAQREAWMKAHPPGFFELRRAYSAEGQYGKVMRRRDTVTQIDDTIFVHGGLAAGLPFQNLREVNDRVRKELELVDQAWTNLASKGVLWRYQTLPEAAKEIRAELDAQQKEKIPPDPDLEMFRSLEGMALYAVNSPLWYRGYAERPESELGAGLNQTLEQFRARRMVMGHTVTTKRIRSRFGGKAVLIDTGMLVAFFQGNPAALEIAAGKLQAYYAGEAAPQPLMVAPGDQATSP